MEIFMTFVGILLLGYFCFMAVGRFPALQKFFKSDDGASNLLSGQFWKESLNNTEVRKRLLFTVGIIVIYKLLNLIPIPGVSTHALSELYRQIESTTPGSVNQVMVSLSPGLKDKFHILTIGFMPYLSACALLQFLNIFIPPLRKKFFSNEQEGRKKIVKMSLILGLGLCLLQSFFQTLWLEKPNIFMGVSIVPNPGWGFRIIAIMSLIAAFCLILWLANLITNKGIGNGFAVLILSDIFVRLILSVARVIIDLRETTGQYASGVIFIVFLIPLILLSIFVTLWKRNVPVQIKGKETSLPLRLSWFARQPVSWAQGFVLLPATLASFMPSSAFQEFAAFVSRGGVFYYVFLALAIFAFAYLYKFIVFNSNFFCGLLNKYGGQVIDGEDKMKAELASITKKVVLYVSIILFVLAVLPDCVMALFKVKYLVASVFGGAAFLIIVGVLYDISERIKVIMQMKESGCQDTCHIAFDETEAIIKKTFLEQNGIQCLVEPIRFTWGMPIRTAIDEYRLNVASENVKSAQELL